MLLFSLSLSTETRVNQNDLILFLHTNLSFTRNQKNVFSNQQAFTTPHPAVGQIVDLLADVGDVRFGLVVCGTAGDVPVGLGQTQDRAL